jgi:hypothetical protein
MNNSVVTTDLFINTSPSFINLINLTVGSLSSQRIGNKITVKEIEIRILFGIGDTTNRVRVLLVQDKMNLSAITAADLLNNNPSSSNYMIATQNFF